jgi:hypothetical protein
MMLGWLKKLIGAKPSLEVNPILWNSVHGR